MTDITEREKAKVALQKAHDGLEVRVRERTAALETANESPRVENIQRVMTMETLRQLAEALQLAKEEADAANAAKTEFLSRRSHELHTPLNAIKYNDLLQKSRKRLKLSFRGSLSDRGISPNFDPFPGNEGKLPLIPRSLRLPRNDRLLR